MSPFLMKTFVLSALLFSQTVDAKTLIFQDRISDTIEVKYRTDYGVRGQRAAVGERGGYQIFCKATGFWNEHRTIALHVFSSLNIHQKRYLDFTDERILAEKDLGSKEACFRMHTYFTLVSPTNPVILKLFDDNSFTLEFEKQ